MKVWLLYVLINTGLLFFYHVPMFFAGVMGFGGGTGSESKAAILEALFVFSCFGALPNLLVFLISVFRKKQVKQHAIWASVFALLTIAGYFAVFSSMLF